MIKILPCGAKWYAIVTINGYTAYSKLYSTAKAAQRWADKRTQTIERERANYNTYHKLAEQLAE